MINSITYRKISVAILSTLLLVCIVQGVGYGQRQASLLPKKIKDDSTHYVVWIVVETDSGTSSGSGVLIDKDNRIVVTNEHIPENEKEVLVFFAVRDSSGGIIGARPFYKDKEHRSTLKHLGYVTRGRVIAKDPDPDLALVELDGLPATASALNLTSIDYSKMEEKVKMGEKLAVHILGHPADRELWHWGGGWFEKFDGKHVHISGNVNPGNSGGPILNVDDDLMIGITMGRDESETLTYAVPTKAIDDLLYTLKPTMIFSIYNNTGFSMSYEVQWKKDGTWKKESLEPKQEQLHSHLFSLEEISWAYPEIRFEDTKNGKESSKSVQRLATEIRFFGEGITEVKDHIEIEDARRYQLGFNSETKKISLEELELTQILWIQNTTESHISFLYRWHENNEWNDGYIESGEVWPNWKPSEEVSTGYPKNPF